ncbi:MULTISPECIES: DUF1127 domain-containing protein [Alphaproteobacteria]|uniref:YjiS-like domain-containing protein n=2 Tax=Alphaproteobacteria TaxID=28211 RepID=A0A512HI81_9HYPH|nr:MULTISPECIES: DUF1127 domain-containing protein [Alphaproteobacteria]GEO85161.1 hypothetical protein RNA01_20930 [Ciceribacter naphthalenivorans]GLR24505.1 hypothetical protein GCM10007920_42990 [Ciceribacter naphthalenivorans]GLT07361.1 hypothetical protein GCM10007926_42990 [Sphingomonas psychrolutea]
MRTAEQMIELDIAEPRRALMTRLGTALTRINSVWRAVCNRRAANRLADLDDFQLNDIGLRRSDIEQIVGSYGFADDPSQQLMRLSANRSHCALRGLKSD